MQHDPSPQFPAPSPLTRIAIAVVEHEGRFLIGQRPAGVPLAGFWEFPGGKVEAGETPQQAAQRECLEEAGIEIVVENPYPRAIHQYDHDRVELHFFACRPVDPRTKAASPFRWVEQANLGDYRFPEANAALVRHLCSRPRRGTPWDSRR